MSSARIETALQNSKPQQSYASENKISSYEIKADEIVLDTTIPLGSGSISTVFKGVWAPKNSSEKYNVAVKQFAPSGSSSNPLKHFENEQKTLALLRSLPFASPNIIQFYGCMPTSKNDAPKATYDIVLEHAAQGSLNGFLKSGQSLNPAQCYQVVAGTINGLGFLHKYNILHRDLNPKNILLDQKMEPKLSDFDFARQVSSNSEEVQEGCVGTPSYIAPETIKIKKSTKKSDIFSFGVTLFDIMSDGGEVYPAEWDVRQILTAIARGKRTEIPSTWPPEIAELIRDCWQQEPQLRPTAVEVMERVKKIGGEKKEIHKESTQHRPS